MTLQGDTFFGDEEGEVYWGFSHLDVTEFVAKVNAENQEMEPGECSAVAADRVQHLYAVWTDDEPHESWRVVVQSTQGAFPVTRCAYDGCLLTVQSNRPQPQTRRDRRIAELEALSNTAICIFCGETMGKDLSVMLDHAKGCEKRPENNLLKRAEQAEAALEYATTRREQALGEARDLRAALAEAKARDADAIPHVCQATVFLRQAEAALAERDEELKHLHSRWDWTEYWFDNLYPSDWQRCQAKYDATKTGARSVAALRARAEEGSGT